MQSYKKGVQHYKQGNYSAAIQLFSRSLIKQPDNKNAFIYRGVAHNQLKQHQQALRDYSAALSIDSKFALAYFNKGIVYFSLKQYQEAVMEYTKAIQEEPSFAKAYYNRGMAYAGLNNHEQAIVNFQKTVSLDPQFCNAYYKLALSQQKLKKYDQALTNYEEVIAIDPNYVMAYSSRGLLLMEMKKNKEAENDLNIALEISPNNPGHYFNLAKYYLLTNFNANAKECFEGGVAIFLKKGQHFYRQKFNFPEEKIGIYRKVSEDYTQVQKQIKQLQAQSSNYQNLSLKQLSQIDTRHLTISIMKAASPTSYSPSSKDYVLQLKVIRDNLENYRQKIQVESPHEKVRRRNADRFTYGVETIAQRPINEEVSNINDSRFDDNRRKGYKSSVKSSSDNIKRGIQYERKSYVKGQVTLDGKTIKEIQETPQTQNQPQYRPKKTIDSSLQGPLSGTNPEPAYSNVRLRKQGEQEERKKQKKGICCCTGECVIY